MDANKERMAGAPSQSVVYFQLLVNWPTMPANNPMLEGTSYA